jgi:hypothetical protein
MKTYEQDFRAWLLAHDVVLAEEGRGRFFIDRESLVNLEKLVGALGAKLERLGEVILEIDTEPPLHRFSKRELKDDVAVLVRRLGHLRSEVARDRAEGFSRAQTSYDRQEIEALAVAIPVMQAALTKARSDADAQPGGKTLKAKRGTDPLVEIQEFREPAPVEPPPVVKPTSSGVVVRRKGPHR